MYLPGSGGHVAQLSSKTKNWGKLPSKLAISQNLGIYQHIQKTHVLEEHAGNRTDHALWVGAWHSPRGHLPRAVGVTVTFFLKFSGGDRGGQNGGGGGPETWKLPRRGDVIKGHPACRLPLSLCCWLASGLS